MLATAAWSQKENLRERKLRIAYVAQLRKKSATFKTSWNLITDTGIAASEQSSKGSEFAFCKKVEKSAK